MLKITKAVYSGIRISDKMFVKLSSGFLREDLVNCMYTPVKKFEVTSNKDTEVFCPYLGDDK